MATTTHGMSRTPEYGIWAAMIHRCTNSRAQTFDYYGGRGISVCERWRESFAAFIEDIGRRPSSTHSLDRIDNDGNYEPGNVRWATPFEQMNNQRRSRQLEIDDVVHPVSAWAQISGVEVEVIRSRITRGWSSRDAVFTPPAVATRPKRTV